MRRLAMALALVLVLAGTAAAQDAVKSRYHVTLNVTRSITVPGHGKVIVLKGTRGEVTGLAASATPPTLTVQWDVALGADGVAGPSYSYGRLRALVDPAVPIEDVTMLPGRGAGEE